MNKIKLICSTVMLLLISSISQAEINQFQTLIAEKNTFKKELRFRPMAENECQNFLEDLRSTAYRHTIGQNEIKNDLSYEDFFEEMCWYHSIENQAKWNAVPEYFHLDQKPYIFNFDPQKNSLKLARFESKLEKDNFIKENFKIQKLNDLAGDDLKKGKQQSMILALHAYHDRQDYTDQQIKNLNENTFGLGYHYELSPNNDSFNYGLMILVHQDSYKKIQIDWGGDLTYDFKIADQTHLELGSVMVFFIVTI